MFRVKGQNICPDAPVYMTACKNPEEKAAWNSGSSQFSNPVLMYYVLIQVDSVHGVLFIPWQLSPLTNTYPIYGSVRHYINNIKAYCCMDINLKINVN